MPAATRAKDNDTIQRVNPDIAFLQNELTLPRLNRIHSHLWFAGRPMPARPLSYQIAASRAITVSEDVHLHLVWEPGRLFLKPLPRYLLSSAFWEEHLVCRQQSGQGTSCPCFSTPNPASPVAPDGITCDRRELYKCALGFILSYAALIQYESDFHIAKSQHLLPSEVTWPSWRRLVWELLEDSPQILARVNKRYLFGELRASRLNKIVQIAAFSRAGTGTVGLLRGYKLSFATYGQQTEVYLGPILGATAYIALALTAMQVGLATETLQGDPRFQSASYGFTVFAILGPLVLVVGVLLIVLVFVIFNGWATKSYLRRRLAFYKSLGAGAS